MKVPCNIIEDLLPLYHDNVCSEESRAMVKEHLQTCEKCRTLLAMMDDNIEEAALVNDDRPIRAMKKAWDRTKKKSFRRGMRIGITVIAVIALLVLSIVLKLSCSEPAMGAWNVNFRLVPFSAVPIVPFSTSQYC